MASQPRLFPCICAPPTATLIPGGQSAQEYEPKGKAAGEINELYHWLAICEAK